MSPLSEYASIGHDEGDRNGFGSADRETSRGSPWRLNHRREQDREKINLHCDAPHQIKLTIEGGERQEMKTAEQSRILIIDDQGTIRKSLKLALEREGYLVETAENGQEALRKSKEEFYNMALVDLRLPDMNGIELLTKMRETVPKMAKIIITGYASLENAIEAVNRGADGYIVKPVNMNKLLETVKEHLKKQQEATKYSEEKVKEFISARFNEHESRASAEGKQKK